MGRLRTERVIVPAASVHKKRGSEFCEPNRTLVKRSKNRGQLWRNNGSQPALRVLLERMGNVGELSLVIVE